jgi:hypothetical protein
MFSLSERIQALSELLCDHSRRTRESIETRFSSLAPRAQRNGSNAYLSATAWLWNSPLFELTYQLPLAFRFTSVFNGNESTESPTVTVNRFDPVAHLLAATS